MARFNPGMELSRLFFSEAVQPLVEAQFPGLAYSAGLIGHGSEVLGFDDEVSTDHGWGSRAQLFLTAGDRGKAGDIAEHLSRTLPRNFRGYSTHFTEPVNGLAQRQLEAKEGEPVNHRIELHTIDSFMQSYLGLESTTTITAARWLTLSEQRLRTIRSGTVFHDQAGLGAARAKLRYYPQDVWLYLLASAWMAIGQEEPFVGRTGDVGDELGSRVVAARLVHIIMRLCFLIEQEYAPYSKWFGTAFSQLKCAAGLTPVLCEVFAAATWQDREAQLSKAYTILAEMHNALGITRPMPTEVSRFHARPYLVINGEDFANAIKQQITDPAVKKITAVIGSVNQLSPNVDLLENNGLLGRLEVLFR